MFWDDNNGKGDVLPPLTPDEKKLRMMFVAEYLKDHDYLGAAIRIGFMPQYAQEYASKQFLMVEGSHSEPRYGAQHPGLGLLHGAELCARIDAELADLFLPRAAGRIGGQAGQQRAHPQAAAGDLQPG